VARDPNTENALAFVQVFKDGSAGYWYEPEQQARLAKDREQAEHLAMLPLAEALADLDVYDTRDVRLFVQAASASAGSMTLEVALQHSAHARPTLIAFAKGKETTVEGPAARQLLAAGTRQATQNEYDDHVAGEA
jgi:hypothetical protein